MDYQLPSFRVIFRPIRRPAHSRWAYAAVLTKPYAVGYAGDWS